MIAQQLAREFSLQQKHVDNIISLIDDGNTIPFIARYRKEMTGSCDDQVLRNLSERLEYLRGLEKRREEISQTITSLELMTEELAASIAKAQTLAELEDIYRPYRPKRRTRATIAKEQGLEPLALRLLEQNPNDPAPEKLAIDFVDAEKGVGEVDAALAGARDILAERFSDDASIRKTLREQLIRKAALASKAAKEEDSVYRLYYDFSEPLSRIPSHRVLAINRGEREGFLKVSVQVDNAAMVSLIEQAVLKQKAPASLQVSMAAQDGYERLIFPSLEREMRNELTDKASEQAISMFGLNLKPLLLMPPVRDRVVLGFDPAYRTGCKIAVVDSTGRLLDHTVIYPTPPQNKTEEAKKVLKQLIAKHQISAIAIGNGTASKESELFVAGLIKEIDEKVEYVMVNEAGASVYSASKLGAKEFPQLDVSVRSAVSIARRLLDPLAELVKIDPKSIGVGQYQHDMPPARLDSTLRGVVEDCVNSVGVDLNTASPALLTYVSGLNATVAENITAYREENGSFASRTQLKKVPRLGPKCYEQCAGFLRIPGAKEILDNTSVHPESYKAALALLKQFGFTEKDVAANRLAALPEKLQEYGYAKAAADCNVGEPTLRDIVNELLKPGRDPRDELPAPQLRSDILQMEDLKPGMELVGTVRNCIDFGVFVDIGVHQDGLVHISELANRFVKHPSELVKVGDVVTVWVLGVEAAKKRISLTMKRPAKAPEQQNEP